MNTLRRASRCPFRTEPDLLSRWLKSRLLAQLDSLEGGEIVLVDGHKRHRLGRGGELKVTVTVRDARAWRRLALGGTVGAAEA